MSSAGALPIAEAAMAMSNLDIDSLPPAMRSYIAQVKRYLNGLVPNDKADALLQDTVYWMQRQATQLEFEGLSTDDAATQAVAMDEPPKATAMALIEDYFESAENGPLIKRLGRANAIVFCMFGMATALYLLLLEFLVRYPSSAAIQSALSPASVHRFYPQGFPLPELSWQFFATVGYPTIAPWFLGWCVGRVIPVRAANVVVLGMLPLILISFLAALSLRPDESGFFFVVLQTVYWLPVSCLVAHLFSLRRSRLNQ